MSAVATGARAVKDVQTYLDGLSLGVTTRRHRMTDTPDHLLLITADGGSAPEIQAASGLGSQAIQREGVQLICRSDPGDGDQAYDMLADSVMGALHGLKAADVGASTYLGVRARTSSPVSLGFDDKGRALFSHSYILTRLV